YYFKGMNKFLEKYNQKPELAIFLEPGMKIKNGHRGVIEIYFKVRGVTGHSARPELSKNALFGIIKAIDLAKVMVENYKTANLGNSTINLAYLRGGISTKDEHGNEVIIECGNKIPDVAEGVTEIRSSVKDISDTILENFKKSLISDGFSIDKLEKRIDKNPLFVERSKLLKFEKIIEIELGGVEYANISKYGYGEGQILNETLGVDCVYIGPGPDDSAHKVDEYVLINELKSMENIIISLINGYCDIV
ncbi:MAG: peptidase dimerization domain-containing protein, partial [Thermodesulfobium sp.]